MKLKRLIKEFDKNSSLGAQLPVATFWATGLVPCLIVAVLVAMVLFAAL